MSLISLLPVLPGCSVEQVSRVPSLVVVRSALRVVHRRREGAEAKRSLIWKDPWETQRDFIAGVSVSQPENCTLRFGRTDPGQAHIR